MDEKTKKEANRLAKILWEKAISGLNAIRIFNSGARTQDSMMEFSKEAQKCVKDPNQFMNVIKDPKTSHESAAIEAYSIIRKDLMDHLKVRSDLLNNGDFFETHERYEALKSVVENFYKNTGDEEDMNLLKKAFVLDDEGVAQLAKIIDSETIFDSLLQIQGVHLLVEYQKNLPKVQA